MPGVGPVAFTEYPSCDDLKFEYEVLYDKTAEVEGNEPEFI